MRRSGIKDIVIVAGILTILAVSAYIVRAESAIYLAYNRFDDDSTAVGVVSGAVRDSTADTVAQIDSLFAASSDSLSVRDSIAAGLDSSGRTDSLGMMADSLVAGLDSLGLGIDSLVALDSLSAGLDSLAVDSVKVLSPKELKDSLRYAERMQKKFIRDSIKAVKDSIRWAKPRVLETGFLPDSLYFKRIVSWNTGPYINEYKPAHIDTTFNDWFSEYPFYKEDVDVVYLGTVGSAVQNVNFLKRKEFDKFAAFAPYLTYSYTPETMPFYNTKTPYTELAYWGTIFAYKESEELNVHFLHTQNITPELNVAFQIDRYGAAGMMNREKTSNSTMTLTANYLGKRYSASGGYIHQKVERQENGGLQDSHMVRDTTVEAKTLAINLQEAENKLARNTFFITHSYDIPLRAKHKKKNVGMEEEIMPQTLLETDSLAMGAETFDLEVDTTKSDIQAMPEEEAFGEAADSLMSDGAVSDTLQSDRTKTGSMPARGMGTHKNQPPPAQASDNAMAVDGVTEAAEEADTLALGDGPMLTVGHIGEISTFSRLYTDNISLSDEVGRNFYGNSFYINPIRSADSTRNFMVENKLFFKLQPWARDAVISNITGGVGHRWNNIYGFTPDMFFTGNANIGFHNLYVYAGLGGEYRKYLNWGADARYTFIGYNQNDFDINAHIGVSFYPFKDKSEPITLKGRFSTYLQEPDWFDQHYYSNHYAWDNNFGKVSKTKVEAILEIPKWKFEASFGYSLVNNYIYHDTLGVIRQHNGNVNVMSAYLKKNFKIWYFHLDNEVLFQYSSDTKVLSLPMFTFRLKYYLEFQAVKNVLTMQIGANVTFNTQYYAPAYNPALGTFQLQERELIGNNPYIDVFVNMQWKRVSVFLKVINVGQGWPEGDMFSAYQYVKPYRAFKIGIHWPFYFK